MTHAHDDISVGTLCLPFIGNCWLIPWGEVVSNPLKAQRLAEEYRERQEAAWDTDLFAVELRRCP